ncbi:MAG: UDP-2,3-diacylglucosamine diphosphatase [Pseudomonadota bacterium]
MTVKRTLFISDLHLHDSRPQVIAAFEAFLDEQHGRCEQLFILGDLFEAWLGDDDRSELSARVEQALSKLAMTGCSVAIMHGNRDFLIGPDFCARCTAQLISDPLNIELYGRKVLLMHGDTLCTDDTEYLAFRARIRQTASVQGLLSKPLAERRQIAAQLRADSREAMSNKAEDIMDVTYAEVEAQLAAHEADILFHGHTHRPNKHVHTVNGAPRERYVLGDWEDNLWYLEVTPESTELICRSISQ